MNWFRTNMVMLMIFGIIFTIAFWTGIGYLAYLAYDKYTATPEQIVSIKLNKDI